MRLSDWRGRAPHKDCLAPKASAVLEPAIVSLGGDADPSCWIAWGEDPATRYVVFVPAAAGLIQVHVRVNVPQEGPRASGKVIRWARVQTGELAVEVASGHRLLSFQLEGQVLRGSDGDADGIASFALELFARIDGRDVAPRPAPRRVKAASKPAARTATGVKRS